MQDFDADALMRHLATLAVIALVWLAWVVLWLLEQRWYRAVIGWRADGLLGASHRLADNGITGFGLGHAHARGLPAPRSWCQRGCAVP
jgi:hypothetical protein